MEAGAVADFRASIAAAIQSLPPARYLLAVSGGRDSMVLLDAFTRFRTDAVAAATFDHGTGAAATKAARLVEREGSKRAIAVVSGGRINMPGSDEAAWRAARWEFLSGWAKELSATVVTAHTQDDQLETVVMRVLRDPRHTSVRGLAAMRVRSPVARPMLDIGRAEIVAYAAAGEVSFVEDPSNSSRAYLRNRVRLDLLPAFERAIPGFGSALLALSRRAADWRESVERLVDSFDVTRLTPKTLLVPCESIAGLSAEALAILWPAIAARAGLALDWRGTERLVEFTSSSRPGRKIPLSGGAEVERTASTFVIRATDREAPLYS
jgi:tRNA(Ile)-lysidine synthase